MPAALITGASTGIGRATALRLARSGWTVLGGVRDAAAGESLVREAGADGRVRALELDVTDAAQIAGAAEQVRALNGAGSGPGRLDALVNNAGIAVAGPLELLSAEDLRRQLEVNVVGQVAVANAVLPALRAARGRIVFISSIGGRIAVPYMAPYAASKHAIEAIADSLRSELHRSHIQVALIEPGSVKTPIWEKGRADTDRLEIPPELEPIYGEVRTVAKRVIDDTERRGVAPEQVAAAIERALSARRMRPRYTVGREVRVMIMLKTLLPDSVFDRVIRRAVGV